MKRMGYEVKSDAKYIAVRPPGKERFTRLKTLGEKYTEEAIKRRLLRNPLNTDTRAPVIYSQERVFCRCKGSFNNTKKISGLQALYLSYCYKMGILPKNRQSTKKLHFLLREDLRKMDEILRQTKLLCSYRIDTAEQLISCIESTKHDISKLTAERTMIVNKLRRCKDQCKISEYKVQRTLLTNKINECRNKLRSADGILERSGRMRSNLMTISTEEQQKGVQDSNKNNRIHSFER